MTVSPLPYKKSEERLNVISHAFGIAFGLVGLGLLIQKSNSLAQPLYTFSYWVYGLSLIVLFTASTLYHGAKNPNLRKKLKVFDHVAIYFLIAGTYTPFTLLGLKGVWGWSIFAAAWVVGIAGMVLKLFFTGKYKLLSTISYVAMGWIIVVAIKPLIQNLPLPSLWLLMWGGVFYTVGAVLYSIKKIPYNHAIFHFFVLGGAVCHFLGVYFYS